MAPKARSSNSHNSNKNEAPQPQSPQPAAAMTVRDRLLYRWLPYTLVTVLVLVAVAAYVGWDQVTLDDDEYGDDGGGGGLLDRASSASDGETAGIFSVEKECKPDDFVTATKSLVEEFVTAVSSSIADDSGAKTATLADWMKTGLIIEKKSKASARAAAAPQQQQQQADKKDERLGKFTFALARWTKGVKAYLNSLEQFCDMQKILAARHSVDDAAARVRENAPINDTTWRPAFESAMPAFLSRYVMPTLYREVATLLNFSMSYRVGDDSERNYDAAKFEAFVDEAFHRHGAFLSEQLSPFREVVMRSLMNLADIAFALEREDYHTVFSFNLLRICDGVATAHYQGIARRRRVQRKMLSEMKKKRGDAAAVGDVNDADAADDGSSSTNKQWPSCTRIEAAFFCTTHYGTHLVKATPEEESQQQQKQQQQDEDDDDDHLSKGQQALRNNVRSRDHTATLFGLLRAAFLEELIALDSSSIVIRTAYGLSLADLGRYESANKALEAAMRTTTESIANWKKRRREAREAEQQKTGSVKIDGVDHNIDDDDDGEDEAPQQLQQSTKVLSAVLNCLERETTAQHLAEVQERGQRLSWDALLLKSKVCRGDDDDGKDKDAPPPLASISAGDVADALALPWPLEHQRPDGALVDGTDPLLVLHLLLM